MTKNQSHQPLTADSVPVETVPTVAEPASSTDANHRISSSVFTAANEALITERGSHDRRHGLVRMFPTGPESVPNSPHNDDQLLS